MRAARAWARDLGRSSVGALALGLPLLYTMETWELADTLPDAVLVAYVGLGLVGIAFAARAVGFAPRKRRREHGRTLVAHLVELLVASVVTATLALSLLGVLRVPAAPWETARHALVHVVPLGLGAAVANLLLHEADAEREEAPPPFRREMAIFALGAAVFAFPIAPTEEMDTIAQAIGPVRVVLMAIASLLVSHIVLYVIEYRGHAGRRAGTPSAWHRWGETLAGYALALGIAAFLLFAHGHVNIADPLGAAEKVVILGLVASFGGAAARVVL